MAILKIDKLTPGMVLAENIRSKTGRLLISQGVELTEQNLLVMRTWGIKEVQVTIENNDNSVEDCSPEATAKLEKALNGLRPLFRDIDLNHPAIKELLRLAAQKKVLSDE